MSDTILIQHAYPGQGFDKMLELTHNHHAEYCQRFDITYQPYIGSVTGFPMQAGQWEKVQLVLSAMEAGYQSIIWLDADALIWDTTVDMRKAIEPNKIGACWHRIPQLNHWNVGVLYIDNTPDTQDFLRQWLAAYPPPPDGWNEQGIFNRMGRAGHTVATLSDKWNATLGVSMVPDAVVLGFHGQGDAAYRYQLMADTMAKKFPQEKAELVASVPEVSA